MDKLSLVSGLQVPEDRSVVEVGQVNHVLALLKLGRVHAPNLASLQGEPTKVLVLYGKKIMLS